MGSPLKIQSEVVAHIEKEVRLVERLCTQRGLEAFLFGARSGRFGRVWSCLSRFGHIGTHWGMLGQVRELLIWIPSVSAGPFVPSFGVQKDLSENAPKFSQMDQT